MSSAQYVTIDDLEDYLTSSFLIQTKQNALAKKYAEQKTWSFRHFAKFKRRKKSTLT